MSERTPPSSGPADHLLPRGEKAAPCHDALPVAPNSAFPSPLVGEGARRADEGGVPHTQPRGAADFTRVSARLKSFARDMRKNATTPEENLWHLLRDRRFTAHKFRRQVPIGTYIADFCCYSAKLVVELDGGQHSENLRDTVRDADFARRGFRTIRVWNNELATNREGVLEAIWLALENKP